jgi:phosphoserine aminotransferase
MYVLEKVIGGMLAIGIDKIRKEMEQKAKLLYDFLDSSELFTAFIQDKSLRSQTVIVADIQKTKKDVKKVLAEKELVVGSGYGENKETQIRIANFPTHSIKDIKGLIKQLQSL